MPFFGGNINWKDSRAHLLLLSKFINPKLDEQFQNDSWKMVLGENPQKAIKRFMKENMIRESNLTETLIGAFTVNDLKEMLKVYGLPVSGNKPQLAQRLAENKPREIKSKTRNMECFICSEEGAKIAENFKTKEKLEQIEVESKTFDFLNDKNFVRAAQVMHFYEKNQVFSRGIGITWGVVSKVEIELLQMIFSVTPGILKGITDTDMHVLRILAGMQFLWGRSDKKWVPEDFELDFRFDPTTAARMVWFSANGKHNLINYKKEGVKKVKFLVAYNACSYCLEFKDKEFKITNVPELPHPNCEDDGYGCRCSFAPITKSWEEILNKS